MHSDSPIPLLVARGLTVTLPGDEGTVAVLDAIDFDLDEGEIVDVIGPSGSGKTTLLRALCRLLPEVGGDLELRMVRARDVSATEWRSLVALLPQKPAIVPGTVHDNLMLPFGLKARTDAERPADDHLRHGLDELGLAGIALDRDGSRLSVGQQARVALLRVLLTEPAVLLLDEADAALDDESAATLREVARRFASSGGGVVRVRHRADDGLAKRRLRLEAGRLSEVFR